MRLAPDLSATPERAYDEHEIHMAPGRPARDANSQGSACLLPEAPMYQTNDIGHDDGEHGPGEPDACKCEENLDVP